MSVPEHRPDTPRRPHSGPRHVVGPLILLSAGVLLLLNNFDVVRWTIWRDIWPFWPLLLVLLGVEALIAGRVAWGTLVLLVILLPVVGVAVSVGDFAFRWHDATRSRAGDATPILRQPLDGASRADVAIDYGGGALDVGPLPPDLAANTLADAQTYGHRGVRFDTRATVQNGRHTLHISPQDLGGSFEAGRLEVRLSPDVQTDLKVESGLTEMSLNLEALQVPTLSLETGASRTRVTLPARGQTAVTIHGGAATIDITVPANVAARIVVDGGPNRFDIDERRFPRQGDEYRSPNFETATDRATIRIAVGASRVAVQ